MHLTSAGVVTSVISFGAVAATENIVWKHAVVLNL